MHSTQPLQAATRPWIFDLTADERATLIATFGGWALDGMDVMIYSFVIPTLPAATVRRGVERRGVCRASGIPLR